MAGTGVARSRSTSRLPLAAGWAARKLDPGNTKGEEWFRERFLHVLTPVTICRAAADARPAVLVQGRGHPLDNPLTIVWIAVPLFLQTVLIFALTYALARWLRLLVSRRGALSVDRRVEPLRGRHRHLRHTLRPLLRCGPGDRGRGLDRSPGDVDVGANLPAKPKLVSPGGAHDLARPARQSGASHESPALYSLSRSPRAIPRRTRAGISSRDTEQLSCSLMRGSVYQRHAADGWRRGCHQTARHIRSMIPLLPRYSASALSVSAAWRNSAPNRSASCARQSMIHLFVEVRECLVSGCDFWLLPWD